MMRDVVRDFTPTDQASVRALVLAGMRERWGDEYDPGANADLDDISASYSANGAEVIVSERGGVVVAAGILQVRPAGRGQLLRVSVEQSHRRQGLGRQVVDELVRRARRRGMAGVVVLTDTPWTSAVALYRSCGFTEVGHDDTDTHLLLTL